MIRLKVTVAYDGQHYHGYQRQVTLPTVQGELEKVIATIGKEDVTIASAGRTDSGVHARGQVFHFDTARKLTTDRWKAALNSLLPEDIRIIEVEEAHPEFHARHHAVAKEYRYVITLKPYDLFERHYCDFQDDLDLELMKSEITQFIGTHDFRGFGRLKDTRPTIKTISKAELVEYDGTIECRFIGSGFLRYMVRSMVGTLIDTAKNRRKPGTIEEILKTGNRSKCGKTASPKGLFLHKVYYHDND